MNSGREVEYSYLIVDVENFPNDSAQVKVHNSTIISEFIQIVYMKLLQDGVQLPQDYSQYGVFYDPNSVDNIITHQKENKEGMEKRRGSSRLKSNIKLKVEQPDPTQAIKEKADATLSVWREFAQQKQQQQQVKAIQERRHFFVVDEIYQPTLPSNKLILEEETANTPPIQEDERLQIDLTKEKLKNEDEIRIGMTSSGNSNRYTERARNRSSSIDLGGLSEVMNAGNMGFWLVTHKTIGAYHLPTSSHLLLKPLVSNDNNNNNNNNSTNYSSSNSNSNGNNSNNQLPAPVYTGPMNFIRVYNEAGSYKTLYRPEDTPAHMLYEELSEKFVIDNYQSYAIYLLKNGLETLLGDESTPLKLVSNMTSKEMDELRFIFKNAGDLKGKTGKKKPKVKPILNLIASASQNGELNLSFQTQIDSYPEEYFRLQNLESFTYNSGSLTKVPPLSHFVNLFELRLVNNNLSEVPDEILNLTNLVELDIGNNCIKEIPPSISKLVNLKEIYFYANQIRRLPEEMKQLGGLTVINMAYNYFTELPLGYFTSFKYLEQLKFSGNQISLIPADIFNIPSILDLNFARNQITVLPETVGNLLQLRWLDLKENKLKSLPETICTLRYLEELIISSNQLTTLPSSLKNLKLLCADHNLLSSLHDHFLCDGVEEMDLSYNQLSKLPTSFFQPENKLTKLNISNNKLSCLPDTIVTLESLTQLNVRDNQLESLPNHLGDLPLKVLDISHNLIQKLPSTLLRNRNLWFLNMADNPIRSLDGLIKFGVVHRQLVDCYFGKNLFSTDVFQFFVNIKNIRTLDLSYNQIKSIPSSLSKLISLQILCLSGNRLTAVPSQIGKLKNLKELYLSCNLISSLPSSLKNLTELKIIDLSHNSLTSGSSVGSILSKMIGLEWIDISLNPLKSLAYEEILKLPNLKAFHYFSFNTKERKKSSIVPTSLSHTIQPSKRFIVSWSDMQGRRDGMEDNMVIKGNFIDDESDFFSVLDGHGGKTVAEFAGTELNFKLENEIRDIPDIHISVPDPQIILQKIRSTFKTVNDSIGVAEIGVMQGATAVVAIILSNYLFIGNVGDTRAVLCRDGNAVRLSYDHKPELPEEESRIRNLGGYVADDNRVNSILAVSRAFGDFALDKFVLCDPFLSATQLTASDQFLIIACDGIWDVLTDQQAVDIVNIHKDTPQRSAAILRDHAFMYSSMDNISCIVIHFQNQFK